MPKNILSQNKIDALISSLDPEIASKKDEVVLYKGKPMRLYDFSTPEKFSREDIRRWNEHFETFLRFAMNTLSSYLRTIVDLHLIKTYQVSYGDFLTKLSDVNADSAKKLYFVFTLSPLDGIGFIQIDKMILLWALERMLGGTGEGEINTSLPLTDNQSRLMFAFISKFLKDFSRPWNEYIKLEGKVVDLEEDYKLLPRVIPYHEAVVRTVVDISSGERFGIMDFVFPYPFIAPLIKRIKEKEELEKIKVKETLRKSKEFIYKWLSGVKVNLDVVLGQREVWALDLLNMHEGNLLILDKKINQLVDIYIEGKLKFKAKLGKIKKNYAIEIKKQVRED